MIAILTDFENSEYLGIMKGVIYSICKNAKITELYNNVEPQNIRQGAWILLISYKFFPKEQFSYALLTPVLALKETAWQSKQKIIFLLALIMD